MGLNPRSWPIPTVIITVATGLAFAFLLWFLFIRPAGLKTEAVRAHATEIQAEAATGAAKDALEITVRNGETIRQIDRITETSSHEILMAPGASATVDPGVHSAGLRALCLRNDRASDPTCVELLHRDGGRVGAEVTGPTR